MDGPAMKLLVDGWTSTRNC